MQILPEPTPAAIAFWACFFLAWMLVLKVRKEGIGWLVATIAEIVVLTIQDFREWRAFERPAPAPQGREARVLGRSWAS